ncbi:multisubunit sodium/proton antiporter, MrpB subunit [Bellilinea caldifistulae]|uniref:Monovalent cation/H+ antiporter subunit B n=1 Tax=Bellilinea caldifistulae TaxID=360411 RepID=A0A0P6X9Q3_9CHLR|nr:Na+/H+ antiporter subunit B [Bellilinea caldifistulae]KPL76441.1 monovalent cation/H+ antiporter subunit B [Bellilinea caldifistulae]GAP12147.1 multisubunit sodium/proton antiporter, MrpB subunit [Bellilinea caldifistulae]
MGSIILHLAARYLMPLLLVFSVFLLIRGHNEIGGGFVGGLVAAAAFILYAIANNVQEARRILRVHPRALIASGLLVALSSGLVGWLTGKPFMTGLWLKDPLPVIGKIGTPLMFDVGVYLVVVGVTLLIIFTLAEE